MKYKHPSSELEEGPLYPLSLDTTTLHCQLLIYSFIILCWPAKDHWRPVSAQDCLWASPQSHYEDLTYSLFLYESTTWAAMVILVYYQLTHTWLQPLYCIRICLWGLGRISHQLRLIHQCYNLWLVHWVSNNHLAGPLGQLNIFWQPFAAH